MQHSDDAATLRRQGYRLTPQRLMVLEVIRSSRRHLTAEEIHAAVLAQHPYVNIATIYRTVQWLQRVGLVAPIVVSGEPIHYEYVNGAVHHHLICRGCGAQHEIGDDVLDALKRLLIERYGFEAQLCHLGIPGVCAACRGQGGSAHEDAKTRGHEGVRT
ncbi:MAG TPA: Fur family transcriptional regulator [Roseiflexaceae bacterium]|nr:Fur family transcriptional regulator [Roseiflexaceae bacterium]